MSIRPAPFAAASLIIAAVAATCPAASPPAPPLPPLPPPPAAGSNTAVQANNDFAFDLYARLAADHAGKNLFFSPYSISVALAMTAEGARGATAEEMGRVLRYPLSMHTDSDTQPWNMATLHADLARTNRQLNAAASAGDPAAAAATRQRIAKLRAELADLNKQAAQLEAAQKWDAAVKAQEQTQKLAAQINTLAATVDRYELRVANALWGEQTYPFLPAYIETIKKHYDTGGVFNVDYKNDFPAARQRINDWTADQTNQRIKDIIPDMPPDVARLVRLILTNAIYFKGEWSDPFDAAKTKDAPFHLADGSSVTAPLMHGSPDAARYAAFNADGSFFATPARIPFDQAAAKNVKKYPAADGYAMVELPYKGDTLSMIVIAPNDPAGLPALEKQLAAGKLDASIAKLVRREVHVNLPKFKLETDYKLGDTLQAMGMKRAFTDPGRDPASGADFTGMSASNDPDDRLYIGAVLHKAFVEVNEKGTEAAAATAVIMIAATSAPADEPFTPTFTADRGFLLLIRDKSSGAILFLGRVTNPVAK